MLNGNTQLHSPSLLEIRHTTTYRYARPVTFGVHRVMFRPRAAHDIRVLQASLHVEPEARVDWIQDVFSNSVAVVQPLASADVLRIDCRCRVEHYGVRNLDLPLADSARHYPFTYDPDESIDLAQYLSPQYPSDAAAVSQWAQQFVPRRGIIHTRDLLQNLNEAIRSDFRYQRRDAPGTQRPAETLGHGTGTCRDFALLMIEALRGLGFPARFVSGYLYDASLDPLARLTPEDEAVMLGSSSSHAWLHTYLPGAGWVPFDPTNSLYGGTDLIRVAYSRTPEQAAPISGTWSGDAKDFLDLAVDVQVSRISAAALDQPQ